MMVAVVMASSGLISSLSLALTVLTVVPMGLLMAPQAVRRDKRVIIAVVLLIAAVFVGGAMQAAAVPDLCANPNLTDAEYWLYSCWLPSWMR